VFEPFAYRIQYGTVPVIAIDSLLALTVSNKDNNNIVRDIDCNDSYQPIERVKVDGKMIDDKVSKVKKKVFTLRF
jgi:hypothetical protein